MLPGDVRQLGVWLYGRRGWSAPIPLRQLRAGGTKTHLNDTVENDDEGEQRREEDRGSHGGWRERRNGWSGRNVSLGAAWVCISDKYAP